MPPVITSRTAYNTLPPRKLCTAGYGNQSEVNFLLRLRKAHVNFVLDVRRKEARSWNFRYRPGYSHIGKLFRSDAISYWPLGSDVLQFDLGNRFDSLDDYRYWLCHDSRPITLIKNVSAFLAGNIGIVPCLLCAERSHEKCHRTIVAELLIEEINAYARSEDLRSWTLQHI